MYTFAILLCRVERGYPIFYTHTPLKQHDDAKEPFVFHELTIGAASQQ